MMKSVLPELLSDKSRLPEIYKLRVHAWENSNRSIYVNILKHPLGWFDEFDECADHLIIKDKDKIIASIRINYYSQFNLHPYYLAINHIENIEDYKELSYLSRLIVDPKYRKMGLSNSLFEFSEHITKLKNRKLIGLDATGFQINNLKKLGYVENGYLNTSKIDWQIEPENQMLLIKKLA